MGSTPRPLRSHPGGNSGSLDGLSAWGTPGRVGRSAVAPGDNRAIVAHSGLFFLPCEPGGGAGLRCQCFRGDVWSPPGLAVTGVAVAVGR